MGEALAAALKAPGSLWSKYQEIASRPGQLLDYARIGGAVSAEIAKLALMPDDSITSFKGKPGAVKRVAWSEPLPLPEIKAVGKVLGCSVNDILLSSVAGALRSHLLERGEAVDGVEIRALVPVNLRPAGQEHRLGNRFGLVALVLPLGIANPLARLYELKRRMEELKGSYQAALTLGLLGLVGMCPKLVQQQILDLLAAKATAVMTNVPGPQQPRYLAGARLRQMMFWVPQSGDIGMGVSILSYDGNVQFGLVADRKFVPQPQAIVDRFRPEFEKLLYTVLMEPWDARRDPAAVEADLTTAPAAKAAAAAPAGARPGRRPAVKTATGSGRRPLKTDSAPKAPARARAESTLKAPPKATPRVAPKGKPPANKAAAPPAPPAPAAAEKPRVPKRFR
jgi:WS/DGAT/MGAT family acyltransferase